MKDFIEGQEIIASVDEALVTREIIKNILK
jgi:hypothetical protein